MNRDYDAADYPDYEADAQALRVALQKEHARLAAAESLAEACQSILDWLGIEPEFYLLDGLDEVTDKIVAALAAWEATTPAKGGDPMMTWGGGGGD